MHSMMVNPGSSFRTEQNASGNSGSTVENSARSDSGPCLQSHVSSSCYSVLDSHSTTPLDSPPDLLTLSQPPSLQPQPPHLVSSSFP
ncbi:hypothetical protein J4Q44_G00045810 [Coregonus suidteri]|uniref:Uncharacterized protein n=1 Tax=Coregonus suidteri TaxID=861788 RepID=A0AAN8M9C7_9TELE